MGYHEVKEKFKKGYQNVKENLKERYQDWKRGRQGFPEGFPLDKEFPCIDNNMKSFPENPELVYGHPNLPLAAVLKERVNQEEQEPCGKVNGVNIFPGEVPPVKDLGDYGDL